MLRKLKFGDQEDHPYHDSSLHPGKSTSSAAPCLTPIASCLYLFLSGSPLHPEALSVVDLHARFEKASLCSNIKCTSLAC